MDGPIMIKCLNVNKIEWSKPEPQFFASAVERGFNSLQLSAPAKQNLLSHLSEQDCRDLLTTARQYSLTIDSLTADRYDIFSLATIEDQHRSDCLEQIQQLLRIANWFEAVPQVTLYAHEIHSAQTPLDTSYETAFHRLFLALEELALTAQSCATLLSVENPACGLLLSPLELREFIDQINNPYLGICFNPEHALKLGNPLDWIEILDHRIIAVTWPLQNDKNNVPTKDIKDITPALERINFQGPIIYK